MFSEDIVIVANLAITVGKLIRKIEKLLVDQELQLQPTRAYFLDLYFQILWNWQIYISLSQNDNGSSKYNDDLTQHAT